MSENEEYYNSLEECQLLAEKIGEREDFEKEKEKLKKLLEQPTSLKIEDYFSIGIYAVLYYILNLVILTPLSLFDAWCFGEGMISKFIFNLLLIFDIYYCVMSARSYYAYKKMANDEGFIDLNMLGPIELSVVRGDDRWNLSEYFSAIKNEQSKAIELLEEIENAQREIAKEIDEEYTRLSKKKENGELHLDKEYWHLAPKLKELYDYKGAKTLQKGLLILKMEKYS